jgi:hypothetical protein
VDERGEEWMQEPERREDDRDRIDGERAGKFCMMIPRSRAM